MLGGDRLMTMRKREKDDNNRPITWPASEYTGNLINKI